MLVIPSKYNDNDITKVGSIINNIGNLESIYIQEGITTLESQLIYGCGNLTETTFPSTLNSIGDNISYMCYSIKRMTILQLFIDDTHTIRGSINN